MGNDTLFAIRKSIKNYTSGGNLLFITTILALVVANSPLSTYYFSWWNQPVALQ